MEKFISYLVGLYCYIFGSIKLLKNWSGYLIDLIRFFLKKNNTVSEFIFRDGTIISIHPKARSLNFVFYDVFLRRDYDSLPQFKIKEEDTIIDIGAHLGFFTISAAKQARRGKVFAFEPFSKHFEILKKNIEQNNFNNVHIFQEAISNKTLDVNFYYTMENDPSDTSLFIISQGKQVFSEIVREVQFDEIFMRENIETCDFLKLDCEGAEYEILMGLSDENLMKIKKIAMEWHRFAPEHDTSKLISFLKDKGFKLIIPSDLNRKYGLLYAYK